MRGRLGLRRTVAALAATLLTLALVASAQASVTLPGSAATPVLAAALARSQNVAIVPGPSGQAHHGGILPTTGFPSGYAPAFTNVSPTAIADGTASDPIATGFDTVVLVQLCDIGTYLADTDFKTRIEIFVANGGKLIIWDSECESTDYSGFVYPFTTSNPGALGATGTLTDVEENTLSSTAVSSPSYVNNVAISGGTDAVGDANVSVTRDPNWCVDMTATNALLAAGPVHTYARVGSGLIIYNGLDMDYMGDPLDSDPASPSGITHLERIWLLELLQPVNPDNLPCAVRQAGGPTSVPSLTIAKANSASGSVAPGTAVAFTISLGVVNTVTWVNVTVVDQLPDGLGNASAISSGGTYDPVTNKITWAGLSVAAGTKLTYSATVASTADAGTYTNTATITNSACFPACSAMSTVTVAVFHGAVLAATATPNVTLPPTSTTALTDRSPGAGGTLAALLAFLAAGATVILVSRSLGRSSRR